MTLEELNTLVANEPAVIGYFSTPDCNVCKVLRPKVEALLEEHYPKIKFVYIDCVADPDTAAQSRVFMVPTLISWFGGSETLRKSRHFGMNELGAALERPYDMVFDDD